MTESGALRKLADALRKEAERRDEARVQKRASLATASRSSCWRARSRARRTRIADSLF